VLELNGQPAEDYDKIRIGWSMLVDGVLLKSETNNSKDMNSLLSVKFDLYKLEVIPFD